MDRDFPGAAVAPLPVTRAADLPSAQPTAKWLVESLWAAEGVGVIGGTPKSCKTWLALDLAVAVASGSPALGRFPVPSAGPVLAYGAEDGPEQLRERLSAICRARNLCLADLDLFLLTVPSLRLDSALDRARLQATLERIRPRLLLLDPFVRLHRSDENSAADMAALLGELRDLQRRHRLAIILVHHLRKNAAATLGGGAARLRRSARLGRFQPLPATARGLPLALYRAPGCARARPRSSRPSRRSCSAPGRARF